MNKIEIKPIELGLPSEIANRLMVRPIIGSTQDVTCNTYYEVSTEEGKVLASGNCPLTEEEYTEWADDNTYVEDVVITKLGLTRV